MPSEKAVFVFTLVTAGIITAAVLLGKKPTQPEGYTIRGKNYSKCDCEK